MFLLLLILAPALATARTDTTLGAGDASVMQLVRCLSHLCCPAQLGEPAALKTDERTGGRHLLGGILAY
jgi:hypothetical protein